MPHPSGAAATTTRRPARRTARQASPGVPARRPCAAAPSRSASSTAAPAPSSPRPCSARASSQPSRSAPAGASAREERGEHRGPVGPERGGEHRPLLRRGARALAQQRAPGGGEAGGVEARRVRGARDQRGDEGGLARSASSIVAGSQRLGRVETRDSPCRMRDSPCRNARLARWRDSPRRSCGHPGGPRPRRSRPARRAARAAGG